MDEQILNILKEMQNDIKDMKSEITGIKSEITGMKSEITGMKSEITGVKSEITGMKEEIANIKETQKEHTEILRALEYNSEIAKSERENMKQDINTTLGKVTSIGNTLNYVEMATAHNWSEITRIKSVIS